MSFKLFHIEFHLVLNLESYGSIQNAQSLSLGVE